MKILVIGSGGREHALAWKLKQSPEVDRIFCAPGNAGTAADWRKTLRFRPTICALWFDSPRQNQVDLTVVGPDDPLAAGIVDLFVAEKLRIFGPTKSAARSNRRKFSRKS